MKVFIDTSAFIAYFIKQEARNAEVTKKYNIYRKQKAAFLTSNYIIDELLTWFNAKYNRSVLEKVITSLMRLETEGEINVLYKNFALDEVFTLDDDFKKFRINTSF